MRPAVVTRHRSSAVPIAWLFAGLIVYASLYPFSGWRVPGVGPLDFLLLGWPRWWTWFDLVANLLGYMPLGFLLFVAAVRSGWRGPPSAWVATLAGTALSLSMEVLQNYLPQRVSSNVDLGLNALGSAFGAGIGLALEARGGIERWQRIRDRWFVARSAGGLTLVLAWPIGLLFPTAVPFGLGHVLGRLRPALAELLAGTPAEVWTAGWATPAATGTVVTATTATTGAGAALSVVAAAASAVPALSPAGELAIVVLGLLAPCLVAFTFTVPGWRRAVLVLGAVVLGALTTTLSTALNFGPAHALAWTTPQALQALVIGAFVAALLSLVPRRVAAGFGLIALTALVMLVAQAPADPYFAQSLQGWEQGRFIRFHGAALWVGWLWPYAALAYLLARLAGSGREPG